MLNESKVSVIIPVYNSEKFLRNSLESVLNQTYFDIEIICVDDGSTDNSGEILKEFSDKIRVITKENQGLASALNAGIDAMNGRWFKWFSPDDVLYPKAIETLVNTAKNLKDNTIIYSNWDIIDKSGKKLRSFKESNYNNLNSFDFNVRLLDGQLINVNTTLIPSSLFPKLLMNKDIDPVLIDYDFFLNAGLNYDVNFHLVDKILLKYRVHSNQFSHKNIAKSIKNISILREEILSKLKLEDINSYKNGLTKHQKQKPISKKSMDMGLKLVTSLLPQKVSDNLLIFYLNKIRSTR